MTNQRGFSLRATMSSRCDLSAPGHQQLIKPGTTYFKVVTGPTHGTFHNKMCYDAARRQMEAFQKDQQLKKEVEENL